MENTHLDSTKGYIKSKVGLKFHKGIYKTCIVIRD